MPSASVCFCNKYGVASIPYSPVTSRIVNLKSWWSRANISDLPSCHGSRQSPCYFLVMVNFILTQVRVIWNKQFWGDAKIILEGQDNLSTGLNMHFGYENSCIFLGGGPIGKPLGGRDFKTSYPTPTPMPDYHCLFFWTLPRHVSHVNYMYVGFWIIPLIKFRAKRQTAHS